MNHYLTITVLPDEEMSEAFLFNTLFAKFHKALSELKASDVGVSFPKLKYTPGSMLRIHGAASRLQQLQNLNWLGGLSSYCAVSSIQEVPDKVEYRVISRKQPTQSNAKLKRYLKHGAIAQDQVEKYTVKMQISKLTNPFVELVSNGGGQRYRRFIEMGPLQKSSVAGEFDQFGFSKTATIPWF